MTTTRAAGVVLLRQTPRRCLCLLLRAYRYWDFPKGEAGEGESLLQTARREVREETGITDLAFPWGQQYTETPPYGSPRKSPGTTSLVPSIGKSNWVSIRHWDAPNTMNGDGPITTRPANCSASGWGLFSTGPGR